MLAAALFAVNVVARLVIRFGFDGDDTAADRVSLAMFVVIGADPGRGRLRWGRRRPLAGWAADMAARGRRSAMLLTVLVGPFVGGDNPFAGGAATFFAQIWLYCAASPSRHAARLPGAHRARAATTAPSRSSGTPRLKAAKPRRVVRR